MFTRNGIYFNIKLMSSVNRSIWVLVGFCHFKSAPCQVWWLSMFLKCRHNFCLPLWCVNLLFATWPDDVTAYLPVANLDRLGISVCCKVSVRSQILVRFLSLCHITGDHKTHLPIEELLPPTVLNLVGWATSLWVSILPRLVVIDVVERHIYSFSFVKRSRDAMGRVSPL